MFKLGIDVEEIGLDVLKRNSISLAIFLLLKVPVSGT